MKLQEDLIYKAIPISDHNWKNIDQAIKISEQNLERLKEIDKISAGKQTTLGRFISMDVADGMAYYQVQEIRKHQCYVVRCAGICLDEWQDNMFGQECWVNINLINRLIGQREALEKLFGR